MTFRGKSRGEPKGKSRLGKPKGKYRDKSRGRTGWVTFRPSSLKKKIQSSEAVFLTQLSTI